MLLDWIELKENSRLQAQTNLDKETIKRELHTPNGAANVLKGSRLLDIK